MFRDNGQKMALKTRDGRQVTVRLEVNPRARRLILRLDEKAREAVAVAPRERDLPAAAAFASERVDWIARQLSRMPETVAFTPGAVIPLRGELCRLSLDGPGRRARLVVNGEPVLHAPGAPETFPARITRYLKAAAKTDLTEAVGEHCERLGVKAHRISVKDTRSRWGSCSSEGVLSFSWRLICAPPEVLDYVAAHECAHLLEMNHSDRFWAHVARTCPDWKQHRHWLRSHGRELHAVGG
ncbi:MAG: M48 family metallopeptidase [Hyphomonadaceae bacterium]|nr:M48 family metallopeptidase [Hyphomonadaceae bacterium]